MNFNSSKNFLFATITGILSLVISLIYYRTWNIDFTIPIFTFYEDVNIYYLIVKNIIDTGFLNINPYLGMPDVESPYSLVDFPLYNDYFNILILKFFCLFTNNVFLILNLFYFFCFFLIAFFSFFGFKEFKISNLNSILFSILFSFSIYRLNKNNMHCLLSNTSIIPLSIILANWIYQGKIKIIDFDSKKILSIIVNKYFYYSLPIIILICTSGIYYTIFSMIIILLVYFIYSLNYGKFLNNPLLLMLFYFALILFITLIINLPSIFAFLSGKYFLPIRYADESFIYGLKFIYLFIPSSDHFIDYLANISKNLNLIINPNESSSARLGTLASIGLVISLLWILCCNRNNSFFIKTVKNYQLTNYDIELISLFSSLKFLLILLMISSGLLSIILIKFPIIRSTARISIIIYFLSLLIIAIFFDKIAQKKFFNTKILAKILVIILVILSFFDQVGKSFNNIQISILKNEFFVIKNFTKEIEKVVSKNAMIFILPVNYFPEAQGDYYRGLSPYLNSSQLRFTYPVNKGSKALEWQENIQKGIENNFNKSVELIRKKGFAGIYYDRIAYQQKYNTKDYFESVEKKLAKIPNSKLIKSPDSIYQFVKFE